MLKLFKNLFKKEEEFNPYKKFDCNVYEIETDRYVGTMELNYFEFKHRSTYDTHFRYSRVIEEE